MTIVIFLKQCGLPLPSAVYKYSSHSLFAYVSRAPIQADVVFAVDRLQIADSLLRFGHPCRRSYQRCPPSTSVVDGGVV